MIKTKIKTGSIRIRNAIKLIVVYILRVSLALCVCVCVDNKHTPSSDYAFVSLLQDIFASTIYANILLSPESKREKKTLQIVHYPCLLQYHRYTHIIPYKK